MRPSNTKPLEKTLAVPEFDAGNPPPVTADYWFDDACILDMDCFVKTMLHVKAKGVQPDNIGSMIAHYASKWLPNLPGDVVEKSGKFSSRASPESITETWMKKRFFVETLIGVLPPEKGSVPCILLLRLLRMANMVSAEPAYRAELEKRIGWQLDQVSLEELMIPSFDYTCGTLLDVELVVRLVKRFVEAHNEAPKTGAALVRVAKLIDCYLAEAAFDANLTMPEFEALAGALPGSSRFSDDGLYRAIDTYLKAHPSLSKQERKKLCRLMNGSKLSLEACLHATQNERLPVRTLIQVLLCEKTKLNKQDQRSNSFSGPCSASSQLEMPARCHSKREAATQSEIRKLREELLKIHATCHSMQSQIERLSKKNMGSFRWQKLMGPIFRLNKWMKSVADSIGRKVEGHWTPIETKANVIKCRTPPKWRNSVS